MTKSARLPWWGFPTVDGGKPLKAVIVAKDPDSPPDVATLTAHARDHLAGFKVPADWEFATELPRNAAGKLLRHRLT